MSSVNRDPVLGIRKAVASGMVSIGMQPSKELIDSVVDHLPDFFKQPLTGCEWSGDPAYKTPSACNDEQNTWRVFHRDIPGRIIAEFYGDKAEEAAKEFCRLAAK